MHTYNAYLYLKPYSVGSEVFQLDPTVKIPVDETHKHFGLTLQELHNISDEEVINIITSEKWNQIRKYRDTLLKESDWCSGEDVPQSIKDSWYPYRSLLRDITLQEDPDNITWPIKP